MSVPKIPGRGALLQLINDSISRKNSLAGELKIKKFDYCLLRVQYQPEIDSLSREADVLAKKFRELYRQAAEAYSDDDGALAKALATEGKEIQRECGSLNDKANALRMELKALHDRIDFLYLEIGKLSEQIVQARESLKNSRKTVVKGFAGTKLTSDAEIEKVLDFFPQIIFSKVKSIGYSKELFWKSASGKFMVPSRGEASWDKDGKRIISIGVESFASKKKIAETISHEIGHVVHEHFLTDHQKAEWYSLYAEGLRLGYISDEAEENEIEDFAESFRLLTLDENQLATKCPAKYTFIKSIYANLSKSEGGNYEKA